MNECEKMKPIDCQKPGTATFNMNTFESKIKQFNLRHPLIQQRFNIHDCYHRLSCFKKGPECSTELPQKKNKLPYYSLKKITP